MSTLAPTYTAVIDRPFSTSYTWAEAVIDHPVEKVWEVAVDPAAWMPANHEWELVSGEVGKVGAFYRLWPRKHYVGGDDCPPPHYHWVGVAKLIRHKVIGYEVWTEQGGSYGSRFVPPSYRGLDSVLLLDLGDGRTQVRGLFIAVTDQQPDQQLDTNEEEELKENVMLHFDNLRKVLDGVPLDPPASESFRAEDGAGLAPTYANVDARPFSTHYVWAEWDYDHPIEKVWDYAIDLPLWMGANHEWEPLAGETGKAGMLWRIWPRRHYAAENGMDPDNVPPPRYHFVGITKAIRQKLLGIEVWTEKGGSYGTAIDPSHRGLDSVLFSDLGGRTNARALFIAVEDPKPDQKLDPSDEEHVAANVMLHFENLGKLLDGIPLDPPATESYRAEDTA